MRYPVVVTSLLPPCPSWCQLPPGHPYEADGLEFVRYHRIGFGGGDEPLLELSDQEYVTFEGRFEYDPPTVSGYALDLEEADAPLLRDLAHAAAAAAELLELLTEHPEPVAEPSAELVAVLLRLNPEPEAKRIRRLILESASV